jgi:cobalamin biosynthetic protein CobC
MNDVPDHGGALAWAAQTFGIAREQWLDLSTGITPFPYPLPEVADGCFYHLPDAALEQRLYAAAAEYYGVSDAERIAGVPGSQAAIQWLPRLFATTCVAILTPTYSEHARSWRHAGHTVCECTDLDTIPEEARVIVLANPNNPDGRQFDPQSLLRHTATRSVIVDEAFADVVPELSLAAHAGRSNLIILRSVGKFFGLAGLRLGFVLAPADMALAMRRAVGPWAVSGPAAAIGTVALADRAWATAAQERLRQASKRLDAALAQAGITIVGGTPLFRLVSHADASRLFDHLARKGILVRAFADRPTWLRFGIPGHERNIDRLTSALHERQRQSAD